MNPAAPSDDRPMVSLPVGLPGTLTVFAGVLLAGAFLLSSLGEQAAKAMAAMAQASSVSGFFTQDLTSCDITGVIFGRLSHLKASPHRHAPSLRALRIFYYFRE